MAIIRWNPLDDFDEFFEAAKRRGLTRLNSEITTDVFEEDSTVVARVNLPGMNPEDIEVDVEDDYLKIKAERKNEKEEEKRNYYYKEIQRGTFERTIRLPGKMKSEDTSADFEDGVLTIRIPRVEKRPERKKVEVRRGPKVKTKEKEEERLL